MEEAAELIEIRLDSDSSCGGARVLLVEPFRVVAVLSPDMSKSILREN